MPIDTLDKIRTTVEVGATTARVSLTELARSRSWRDTLAKSGVVEVVQHADIVAYIVEPHTIRALTQKIDELESELEYIEMEKMVSERAQSSHWTTGEEANRALGHVLTREFPENSEHA